MNTELASACKCFGLYDENNIIGFMGVLHQPHGKHKNLKRCSRMVILPDYQGIGLEYKFLTEIANFYKNQSFDFSIVTSAKNLIMKLNNAKDWKMIRLGVNKCSSSRSAIDYKRSSMRSTCKTASFMYLGEK